MVKDKTYKWKLLFFIYLYFIFDKTLLGRSANIETSLRLALALPDFWDKNSHELNIEAIENFIFFIPYIFFLLKGFSRKKSLVSLKNILIISFLTSLLIEVLQYNFDLGSFQVSDLLHNTLGGLMGYLLYGLINIKISKENKSR